MDFASDDDDDDDDEDFFEDEDETTERECLGKLRTVNLVSTFDVDTIVPVYKLITDYPHMFKLHQQVCKFRLKTPRTTFKLFASGNALLVGARTQAEVNAAVWLFVGILQTHGVPEARVRDVHIRNNTSTTQLSDGYFDLARLEHDFQSEGNNAVMYKPILFPGARIRFDSLSVVVLAFMSNKFNITGATTIHDAQQAFAAIKEIHERYVVRDPEGMRRVERIIEAMRTGLTYPEAAALVDATMDLPPHARSKKNKRRTPTRSTTKRLKG